MFERISTGQSNGNGSFGTFINGASADGTRVFFSTVESLEPGDTDTTSDIYERSGSTTTRISTGPSGGNGAFSSTFWRASADGTRVFFSTQENLVPTDTDSYVDIYERSGSTTTRISTTTGPFDADFVGSSADGSRVFFTTLAFASGDTDSAEDIYERSGSTTTRISTGSIGGNGAFTVAFEGYSADGSRVFFTTAEPLEPGDTDSGWDLYERSGSTTTRIGGNGAFNDVSFSRASADGTRVFFRTAEPLEPGDTDSAEDIYERSGSTTTRISTGSIGGNGAFNDLSLVSATADGTRVFFRTAEPLEPGDTDSSADIYERSGSTTTRISTGSIGGNGAFGPSFNGSSADGSRVFFTTAEPLEPGDTDSSADIYERSGSTTTRISTGSIGGNGVANPTFRRASADGARVFFETPEPLEPGDTDSEFDVYERSGSTTTRISTGSIGGNGAFYAGLGVISTDGARVVFTTSEALTASDLDAAEDLYLARYPVTSGYPRPKGATPVRVPLVPAYGECTEPSTTHQAPFAFGSCNPPDLVSEYLTVGSPDANGAPAKSVGFVSIVAQPGVPGGADDADATLAVSLEDVRRQTDLADFTGELGLQVTLRITDRANGATQNLPGTVMDLPLTAAVPCTATGDTTVGSTCSLVTSLDTLLGPSATPEGKRAIYGVTSVGVWDGGPDGDADTGAGNTLFAMHGFFIP